MAQFHCSAGGLKPILVDINDTSLEECARICGEAPGCQAFTTDSMGCSLQGSLVQSKTIHCTKHPLDKEDPNLALVIARDMCSKVVRLCNNACNDPVVRRTPGCYDCFCRFGVLCRCYMELGVLKNKGALSPACCKELCCICCCIERLYATEIDTCLALCQPHARCRDLVVLMDPLMKACRDSCVILCKISDQCCTSICAGPICGTTEWTQR